jgi:hypothetical protein
LATSTLQATPYLWSDAVSATIHAAPELPPHVVSRSVLPFPQMFWALETPWSMMTLTNVTVAIEFFLLLDQGTSFVLICCVDANGRESEVLSRTIAYGTRYPEEIEPESLGGIVLQHLSFLNSPYIKSDEERIERAVRRRCARVSPEEAEKTIRVVTLRRPSKPTTSTAEPGSREWKHQWWVTGHHRAQWYASEQAHRVRWIAPYLKGPSDKPVLDKVYAVKQ